MAAKMINFDASATAQGTTTVYTVPASKAARIRVQFFVNAPSTSVFTLTVNAQTIFSDTSAGNEFALSGATLAAPATGVVLAFQTTNPLAANPPTHISTAIPAEYIIAAGDTVTYTIATADATSVRVQVWGVEDDAA